MRRIVLVLLIACGQSKDAPPPPPPSKPPEPAHVTNGELAEAKLDTTSGTAGVASFTIDLPMSLLRPASTSGDTTLWIPKADSADTPTFVVHYTDLPFTTDGSVAVDKDSELVRQDKLPDGGVIVVVAHKDHKAFHLDVCRAAHGGTLCCDMAQSSSRTIALDQAFALGEKICRSMKSS